QWAMAATGGGGSATGTVAARIGKTMLTEALINGGQELVLQGASQERKKAAGLEYGMDDMLKNAGIAATFGALFGGTIEGGGAIARAYGLGEESAARASRILDGNPERGDVEAMAADIGVTLTEEQKSQVNRSFEERVLDEHMLPADASPDQVRVFEAAKNYAEDPDNFPEPELVERAIADEQSGVRSLTADDYERLYSGGDPDAIDDIRDTFFVDEGEAGRVVDDSAGRAVAPIEPEVPDGMVRVYHSGAAGEGETGRWVSTDRQYASDYRGDLPLYYLDVPEGDPRINSPDYPGEQGVKQGFTFNFETNAEEAARLREISREPRAADPLEGQRIRPERAIEPIDDAAMREAEQLAGDIVEPRIDANGNAETLLDFVPLQDSDGNIRLVPTREALEAADQENWFADVLEACKV
ncbi:hypothetical protein MOV76_38840, partial [Rhizobium sp. PRIMUS64]|uniref:hypothetical protein n=1 Tax=Rhizobium sp. PRIMUS64 TaxID=2908925 RepID=UPI001FF31C5C